MADIFDLKYELCRDCALSSDDTSEDEVSSLVISGYLRKFRDGLYGKKYTDSVGLGAYFLLLGMMGKSSGTCVVFLNAKYKILSKKYIAGNRTRAVNALFEVVKSVSEKIGGVEYFVVAKIRSSGSVGDELVFANDLYEIADSPKLLDYFLTDGTEARSLMEPFKNLP